MVRAKMCLRGSLVPNWRGLRFLSCFESTVGRPLYIRSKGLFGGKKYYSSSQNRLELPLSNKKDTIYTSLLLLDKILRIYNFFGHSRIQYCAKSLVLWFLIGVVVINCFGNLLSSWTNIYLFPSCTHLPICAKIKPYYMARMKNFFPDQSKFKVNVFFSKGSTCRG